MDGRDRRRPAAPGDRKPRHIHMKMDEIELLDRVEHALLLQHHERVTVHYALREP